MMNPLLKILLPAIMLVPLHRALPADPPADQPAPGANARADARPNFVVVLADDMRYDYLGAVGLHPVVETPELNRLAEQGTIWRNAFATSTACTPSRTSLLTGQYERRHGVTFGSNSSLSEEAFARTYPMLLGHHGYFTGYVGKNHTPIGHPPGYHNGIIEKGFDYWYGNHGHSGFYPKQGHPNPYRNATADTQIEIFAEGVASFLDHDPSFAGASGFLRARPTDRPFCLLVNFNLPHGAGAGTMRQRPGDPELYRTAYRDQIDRMPRPATYLARNDILTPKLPTHVYNGKYINQYDYVRKPDTLAERQVRTCQTVA